MFRRCNVTDQTPPGILAKRHVFTIKMFFDHFEVFFPSFFVDEEGKEACRCQLCV